MDSSQLLIQYAQGQRNFQGITLHRANLYRADLTFVDFNEANLQKADLRYINLTGASLNHANLSSVNLTGAILIGADLIRVNLSGSNLSQVLMSGANLSGANLRHTDLSDTVLAGANLSGADLSNAILKNTNLEGANLTGTHLVNTNLEKIDLKGLNLEAAILSEIQIYQLSKLGFVLAASLDASSDEPTGVSIESEIPNQSSIPDSLTEVTTFNLTPTIDQNYDPNKECRKDCPYFQVFPICQRCYPSTQDNTKIVDPKLNEPDLNWEKPADTSYSEQADQLSGLPKENLVSVSKTEAPKQKFQNLPALTNSARRNTEIIPSLQAVLQNRIQYQLQKSLLEAYHYQCAITGCNIRSLLEITLIALKDIENSDHPSNGLVLRADLKVLYKLRLITIDPGQLVVLISPGLQDSEYSQFQGKKIFLPTDPSMRPNQQCLLKHIQTCSWYTDSPQNIAKDPQEVESFPHETLFQKLCQFTDRIVKTSNKTVVIGGVVAVLLVGGSGLIWLRYASRPGTQPHQSPSEIASPELIIFKGEASPIRLEINSVISKQQGMLINQKSYVPLSVVTQIGVQPTKIPKSQQIQYQGQQYLQVTSLKALGIEIRWNGESRTISLTLSRKSR